MGEKEITLFQEATPKQSKASLFPEEFPASWRVKLEEDFFLEFGSGAIDLDYAIRTCRDWSLGGGKKRVNWVAVIRNGVRRGWLRPQSAPFSARPSDAVRGALMKLGSRPPGRLGDG